MRNSQCKALKSQRVCGALINKPTLAPFSTPMSPTNDPSYSITTAPFAIKHPAEHATPPSTPMTTRRKALTINLDEKRYGTFAEIGAGQEVARNFFQVGGAAGTIAKTMSAYDMTFSDAIYGKAQRYVSCERLTQMLEHEYTLLIERLGALRGDNTHFFVFANTVSARNFSGTNECHGWMGVHFQRSAGGPANEIIAHVRMLDKTNIGQQEALGVFGVNLIFGAFYLSEDPDKFIASLTDNLDGMRIEVDMLEFNGPDFEHIENRVLSLKLVEQGLTNAVMFGPNRHVLQPSEALHKKAILVQRGSFRPITHVNIDMLNGAQRQFQEEPDVKDKECITLLELTINKLQTTGQIDYADFLARVDAASSLGYHILVSDYFEFYRLSAYFRRYTQEMIGIVLGINTLMQVFNTQYYKSLDGGVLEACGRLFKDRIRVYAYPMKGSGYLRYIQLRGESPSREIINNAETETLLTSDNLHVIEELRGLYSYLKDNHLIRPVHYFNPDYLEIFAPEVMKMIQQGEKGWERFVPPAVAKTIAEHALWGYRN